jgi:TolA-binding protein
MIGLLGTCMSVLLAAAADGGAAGLAGPAGEGLEPTTQATSQPVATSQPSDGEEPANVRSSLRRLWRESLQPPTGTPTASDKLRQTMEELRRVRVSPRSRTKQGMAAAVGRPTSRPAELASRPADANDSTQAGLSKAVVEKLKGIPTAALASPSDLADELFQSGHLAAAAAMYERAIGQGDDDTKAWALYQMGNCRRIAKPQEAEALYLQVIRQHGKSPWAQLAAVEQKLLEWQRVNRPLELLDSLASLGRAGAQGPTTQPTTRAATNRPTSRPTSRPTTRPATMPGGAKTQAANQPRTSNGTVTVRTRTSSPLLATQTQPDETTMTAAEPETVVPRTR